MTTNRGAERRTIEWDDHRTRDGYRYPECGNHYELKDSFCKHYHHKHATGTTGHAGHSVNAVRCSSLPESGHGERERKRSHSTDDKRRGESRAATASAYRKKDRHDSRARGSEDTTGVLEMLEGVVTVDLPGYNPEDPRMDPASQIPQAPLQATGVVYQPTPIHPVVIQAVSMVIAAAGKEPATQSGDSAAADRDPGMELGEPVDSQPNETVPEKGGEGDASGSPAGESGLSVEAEVTPKVVEKTGTARPTGKEEEEKGTPKLLLKRVSVQAYQQRMKDQETPETEASRPSKPTAIITALESSDVGRKGKQGNH